MLETLMDDDEATAQVQRLKIHMLNIPLKCMWIEKFSCEKTLLFERTLEIIYTNSLQLFHILLRS